MSEVKLDKNCAEGVAKQSISDVSKAARLSVAPMMDGVWV